MRNVSGFTFIELMFVVVIIGILAAVALPAYQDYTIRAKIGELLIATSEMRSSVNEFYQATGRFPNNNVVAGLAQPKAYRGRYFDSALVENGAIHIHLGQNVGYDMQGQYLSFRPIRTELALQNVRWLCGYAAEDPELSLAAGEDKTDIERRFLPSVCR